MIRAVLTAVQCRVLHSLTIISQPFPFVKGFFKTFLSFFVFFQAVFLDSLQSGCEAHYITFGSLCQVPFQKFFQLFFVISCAPSRFRLPAPLTAQLFHSLHIIALSFSFVNPFLTSFFGLELQATMHKERASRLCNLPNIWLILIPSGRMGRVLDTHFPRFQVLQPTVGILRDHPHTSRGRSVHHEGLDEPIVYI